MVTVRCAALFKFSDPRILGWLALNCDLGRGSAKVVVS